MSICCIAISRIKVQNGLADWSWDPAARQWNSLGRRLPKPYQLRWYPDITHCVRRQYQVPWMDPALGLTIGREPVNPRPVDYTQIYHMDYTFTDGFLSYSDGVNDDFNKCLWSQLAWNPQSNRRHCPGIFAILF